MEKYKTPLSIIFFVILSVFPVVVAVLFILKPNELQFLFAANDNFYIDCDSGSDGNTGLSEGEAWMTLDPVREATFEKGDTIHFKRGCTWDTGYGWGALDYNEGLEIDESGDSENLLTITAYGTGDAPILQNSHTAEYASIITTTGSWIVIENLELQETNESGIFVADASENVTMQNLEIFNVGMGVSINGPNSILKSSNIHDLKMIVNTDLGLLGEDDDYGAIGVKVSSSNNEIVGNTFTNCIDLSYDFGVDGGAIEFYRKDATQEISNNYIHHNLIQDSEGIVEIGSDSSTKVKVSNNIFAYNVLINNGSLGAIHLGGKWGNVDITDLELHNNTIFERASDWNLPGDRAFPSYYFRFSDGLPLSNTIGIYNNIVYLDGFGDLVYVDFPSHSHNLFYMTNIPPGGSGVNFLSLGTGDSVADPIFEDVTEGSYDLHLQETSPAIDQGKILQDIFGNDYSLDKDGNAVPVDGVVDIGAYEYQSGVVSGECGNGVLETGEQCDDGNNADGDGCTSNCLVEGIGDGTICGNGIMEIGEQCDDGNNRSGDGCTSMCRIEAIILHEDDPVCGNGELEDAEECDDGNTLLGDGCSNLCKIESEDEEIVPVCGNLALEVGEECDDGNVVDADGCSASCVIEAVDGPECGNGFVEIGEGCDDGNEINGDLCTNDCQVVEKAGTANKGEEEDEEVAEEIGEVAEGDDDQEEESGSSTTKILLIVGGILLALGLVTTAGVIYYIKNKKGKKKL